VLLAGDASPTYQGTVVNPNEAVQRRGRVPHVKQSDCLDQVAAKPDHTRSDTESASRLGENEIACPEGLVHQARIAVVSTQCVQENVDRIVKPMASGGLEQVQHLASQPSSGLHAGE
jgi:hypothetical protein